jgi:hypothetical protein
MADFLLTPRFSEVTKHDHGTPNRFSGFSIRRENR